MEYFKVNINIIQEKNPNKVFFINGNVFNYIVEVSNSTYLSFSQDLWVELFPEKCFETTRWSFVCMQKWKKKLTPGKLTCFTTNQATWYTLPLRDLIKFINHRTIFYIFVLFKLVVKSSYKFRVFQGFLYTVQFTYVYKNLGCTVQHCTFSEAEMSSTPINTSDIFHICILWLPF